MRTPIIKVDPINPDTDKIRDAALVLAKGGLVAFPTETVYGLGANLEDERAVQRLYKVKNRPKDKPFSIHIGAKEDIQRYAFDIAPYAWRLINRFWPGPLTLILKSKHNDKTQSNLSKVGLRMPNNKIALNLLIEVGTPVVVPSANISSHPPAMNAQDVLRDFDGTIDLVIDGGKVELGIESTVADVTTLPIQILREGVISREVVDKISKTKGVLFVCTGNSCRSVMAKYLLEKQLSALNKDNIFVSSCGVSAIEGALVTSFTQSLLQEEGINARTHQAVKLNRDLLKQADLILAMESLHLDEIRRIYPEFAERAYLLSEFTEKIRVDIKDPIGKPEQEYRECFVQIKNLVNKLADQI